MGQQHTLGPWQFSAQKGIPGHCFVAQVWGPDGKSLACIEPTNNENIATANAQLIAAAPELLESLETAIRWLRRLEQEYPGCLNEDAIDKHLSKPVAKAKGI